MARALRHHQQQELYGPRGGVRVKNGRAPERKARSRLNADGTRRRKPGRPRKAERAGSPHGVRPQLDGRDPLHIVLRVVPTVGSLRKRFMYRAVRWATIAVAMRELHDKEDGAFRIVHISIQRTHVHLLVEATTKLALARGMQSFQISAAKHINREYSANAKLEVRRRGAVFPDRYHQEIIKTPKQARHALAYVLNNWRKHRDSCSADMVKQQVERATDQIAFLESLLK